MRTINDPEDGVFFPLVKQAQSVSKCWTQEHISSNAEELVQKKQTKMHLRIQKAAKNVVPT